MPNSADEIRKLKEIVCSLDDTDNYYYTKIIPLLVELMSYDYNCHSIKIHDLTNSINHTVSKFWMFNQMTEAFLVKLINMEEENVIEDLII